MGARGFLPPGYVDQHNPCSHDAVQSKPGIGYGLRYDLETTPGLTIHVAWGGDSTIGRNRSGAGDRYDITHAHGSRETDAGLEG